MNTFSRLAVLSTAAAIATLQLQRYKDKQVSDAIDQKLVKGVAAPIRLLAHVAHSSFPSASETALVGALGLGVIACSELIASK